MPKPPGLTNQKNLDNSILFDSNNLLGIECPLIYVIDVVEGYWATRYTLKSRLQIDVDTNQTIIEASLPLMSLLIKPGMLCVKTTTNAKNSCLHVQRTSLLQVVDQKKATGPYVSKNNKSPVEERQKRLPAVYLLNSIKQRPLQ